MRADLKAVRDWVTLLHGTGGGWLSTSAMSGDRLISAAFPHGDDEQLVNQVDAWDRAGLPSIYLRCTTMTQRPATGRGGNDLAATLPGLWADLDIAGPGHKATPAPLPPDEDGARQVIGAAGLPEPSAWVHSGGGLYPWWLLDTPHQIDDRQAVADLSARWQDALARGAAELGWHYGTAVKDLARILRIPGTINRKVPDEPVLCRLLNDTGLRYTLAQLVDAAAVVTPTAPVVDRPAAAVRQAVGPGKARPGDDFNSRTGWDALLGADGWVWTHRSGGIDHWRRPGKDSGGHSATTNATGTDRLKVHSTDAGLPNDSMDRFGYYAHTRHRGDIGAATRDLARLGYGTPGAATVTVADLLGARENTQEPAVSQPAPADVWDEPLPLGYHVQAPPFPVDVLPPALGRYITALSEATQTPLDLPGTVALGILAAAIGGRVTVQCPTWVEPTNLFTVPVLPPASRKSAVVAACRAPLDEAEQLLREAIGDQVHDSRTEYDVLSKRAETMKTAAAKPSAEPVDLAEAQEAVRKAEHARSRVKVWPRLSTADTTPEALVSLLAEQGGRIAAISAEAGVFASLTGRYAKTPNLDPVLMAHAGDTITVDRRSREPEHVPHPALTVVASIQPYALREMVDRDDFAGRGLLARVLWSLPVDNAGFRRVRDVAPVPEAVTAAYRTLVVDLAVWAGSRRDGALLRLDAASTEVLLSYAERVERLLRRTGALGEHRLTREWGGKLVGAAARIAGCLHAARGVMSLGEPIGAAVMRSAVALGEYFRAHAVLALSPADDKRAEAARTLLEWLVDKGRATFTMREVCRSGPRAVRKAEVLGDALAYLADLGWVRQGDAGAGYVVHPHAEQHLNRGDSGDNGDSHHENTGHGTYEPPPHPVATHGDTWRQDDEVSPVVAMGGDRPGDTLTGALSWGNETGVAVVAAVATSASANGASGPAERAPCRHGGNQPCPQPARLYPSGWRCAKHAPGRRTPRPVTGERAPNSQTPPPQ